jgi:DNA-3-methyladenine glycosylase I
MTSYCEYLRQNTDDFLNKTYHDEEYGFPLSTDSALLERLAQEIFQAGLSWTLILKRKDLIHKAFDGFEVDTVAGYGEEHIQRLLSDPGIIRNRLKVNAIIENARRIQNLHEEFGSFNAWLDRHHPMPLDEWVVLFKKTFVFTGGEIVREFLISSGYLPGAHDPDCPVFQQIAALNPAWSRK